MKFKKNISGIILFFFLLVANLYSQADSLNFENIYKEDTLKNKKDDSNNISSFIKKQAEENIKFYGEAGAFGEIYTIRGRERRRKPTTGRLYLRPTLSVYETFTISFDLFVSTEGSSARQQIGQLSLQPEWSWGKAYLGDYTTQFTPLTLNGIMFRGGGVDLRPSSIKMEAHYGQTQRAIKSDPFNSTYSRYLLAARLGYGKSNYNGIFINFIRSKDDVKSLPKGIFLRDTLTANERNQFGVTPQENLVISSNFGITLLDKMASLGGEFAGSIFTRDLYATAFDSLKLPEIAKGIYKPRISTNADYAYLTFFNFNSAYFSLKADYQEINPGFVSHGLSSNINDRKALNISTQASPLKNYLTLQFNYSSQSDNLLKQKVFTTERNSYAISSNIRPTNYLGFVISYLNNKMANDAKKDTFKINFLSQGFNVTSMFQIKSNFSLHTISLGYANQSSKDKNILRRNNDISSQSINLNYNFILNSNWNFGGGATYTFTNSKNASASDNISYFLRINNRIIGTKLNNSFTFNHNISNSVGIINFALISAYSLDKNNSLRLTSRFSVYNGRSSIYRDFSEFQISLGYAYRF